MAGSMPQASEGYRPGSCWIPIRQSHDSISDCHILAQLRGLLSQNGGSIPLRRQKDFRSYRIFAALITVWLQVVRVMPGPPSDQSLIGLPFADRWASAPETPHPHCSLRFSQRSATTAPRSRKESCRITVNFDPCLLPSTASQLMAISPTLPSGHR